MVCKLLSTKITTLNNMSTRMLIAMLSLLFAQRLRCRSVLRVEYYVRYLALVDIESVLRFHWNSLSRTH